mmetsp:Transcript_11736/g.38611  ORF Transcript_11736/g.38611 Transcript_11736/m.38611 type:complete len:243 (-) Transcript_11736:498-1226(-)
MTNIDVSYVLACIDPKLRRRRRGRRRAWIGLWCMFCGARALCSRRRRLLCADRAWHTMRRGCSGGWSTRRMLRSRARKSVPPPRKLCAGTQRSLPFSPHRTPPPHAGGAQPRAPPSPPPPPQARAAPPSLRRAPRKPPSPAPRTAAPARRRQRWRRLLLPRARAQPQSCPRASQPPERKSAPPLPLPPSPPVTPPPLPRHSPPPQTSRSAQPPPLRPPPSAHARGRLPAGWRRVPRGREKAT